jgi:hypothetical protein
MAAVFVTVIMLGLAAYKQDEMVKQVKVEAVQSVITPSLRVNSKLEPTVSQVSPSPVMKISQLEK